MTNQEIAANYPPNLCGTSTQKFGSVSGMKVSALNYFIILGEVP
jgi:hypothetical protein